MIYSMTAFSRMQSQGDWGSLVCEIRSINHRYLEMGFHLPDAIRALEMPIREQIKQQIKRGKIECMIRYQPGPKANTSFFAINMELSQALCHASEKIAALLKHPAEIEPTDILRFPGVLEAEEVNIDKLKTDVLSLLDKTLQDLVAARGREGEGLSQFFLQRMDLMQQELAKVRERLPAVMMDQRERLNKRFVEAKIELDPNRLEQEILLYAQRIDVTEEIERTETHLTEIKRILQQGGAAGRRLDFLLQELNREANTLGSKSVDPVITHAAVEMKVLIEQFREQVQNIE